MKKKVKIVIGGTFYGDYFGEVDERPGRFGKPKGQGTLKTKEGMPDWLIPLINRKIKEGKIKDKNYEPMKPINPHK